MYLQCRRVGLGYGMYDTCSAFVKLEVGEQRENI